MTPQTLHQGSLRPAVPGPHPGLQVHSIAAPTPDRRLSFLVSANIYCAMVGVLFLVSRTAPDLIKKITQPEKVIDVVLQNPPAEATHALAPPPLKIQGLENHPANIAPLNQPLQPSNPDVLPDRLPTQFSSGSTPFDPTQPITHSGDGHATTNGIENGPGGAGKVMEVDFRAVHILQQVQPVYPNLARLAHKEGDVVLLMTINEQGVPTDVQVDSGEPVFRGDALRAAHQWRFSPATVDGQARAARFKLILQFRLRG